MNQGRRLSGEKRAVEMAHRGRPVEEVLRTYHELGWTQGRIAEELQVTRQTVVAWFRLYGIQTTKGRRVA
jgi:hypothetical protein